jgi:mono/diheme cytochrome c family protein
MPMPTLSEMFRRLLRAEGLTRAARSVEAFGWLDLVLGTIILLAPYWVESVLHLPPLTAQGANYLRLAGLLVSGLGMLYVVSGRLNATGFVFASLLDRPLVPPVMLILWSLGILPGALALAFAVADFGGFLWTLWAWRADVRQGAEAGRPGFVERKVAGTFGFVSGVVRNARTFHPDGRVFLGTVRKLDPADERLAQAAGQLEGAVLLRMGMGLMKKGWPRWLADLVPDAPSIAARFFSPETPGEVRLARRPGEDLDVLCTAGGDRLWKLVLNLMTGGRGLGLRKFDYFQNFYYAQVPYRIAGGQLDVWIRFVPDRGDHRAPADGVAREQALTAAVADHAVIRIEAQRAGDRRAPFVPFAEIRFEEEIQVDQEALHFDPVTARGYAPYGYLTDLRRSVYPASVQGRSPDAPERVRRENESAARRLSRFLHLPPSPVLDDGGPALSAPAGAGVAVPGKRRWVAVALLAALGIAVLSGLYLALRFTGDTPVEYASEVDHFKYGSTGGERASGFPYWIWVALPELFPELLPDGKPGRGYASFGMIYEKGKDPRYDLPIGVSRRKVQGLDRVFLNCAVCHTGTVRDAPGAPPRVIAGMPANTFDIGAFEEFLMKIPVSEKFTGQSLMGQIRKMQGVPHREVVPPDDLINRVLVQYIAVSLMRDRLLMIRDRLLFIDPRSAGPGRVDTFNNPKALLNFPTKDITRAERHGNSDFPSVWNQEPREGMQLHWDGNNTSVDERNLSAAFGTGAYPPTLDADRVLRTSAWLKKKAKPPDYPYPYDRTLAAQGLPIYQEYCAGCHGTREAPYRQTGSRVGTVVAISDIGTDRHRLDSYTETLAVNQGTLYAGYEEDWGFDKPYPRRFTHFRKTNGYANSPLDGIWLRAPYLHNGSVPNLRELLEPAAARTKVFYRGGDVYDPANVGFVWNQPVQDGRALFRFDTAQDGNGNGGHEGPAYGTALPPEEKRALLEYLKTF